MLKKISKNQLQPQKDIGVYRGMEYLNFAE